MWIGWFGAIPRKVRRSDFILVFVVSCVVAHVYRSTT